MTAILSRIGTACLVLGFVLVVWDFDRDFGWRVVHITKWIGLALVLLGGGLKLPKWINR